MVLLYLQNRDQDRILELQGSTDIVWYCNVPYIGNLENGCGSQEHIDKTSHKNYQEQSIDNHHHNADLK